MAKSTEYVVKVSRAKMPGTCMGGSDYYRIAVMEMEDGAPEPRMISERAKGCVRIVRTWEKLYRGTTERCAFERALAEAEELAYDLAHPGEE